LDSRQLTENADYTGPHNPAMGIRFPLDKTLFFSPRRTYQVWNPQTLLVQWTQMSLSPGIRRPQLEADEANHSPPNSNW